MLKQQYLLPYDSESLYAYAWEQFNHTVSELEAVARQIDPKKTWQQIALEVKNEYPAPDQMIQAHQDWVDKSAAHIRAHDLVPIPWKEQVTVVPRAEYLRKTSYYGNFSRAPGENCQWRLRGAVADQPVRRSMGRQDQAGVPGRARLGRDHRDRAARDLRGASHPRPLPDAQPPQAAADTRHFDLQ